MTVKLKAATFNLDNGRNRGVVAAEVATYLKRHDLDVMAVQEAGGYVTTLRRQLRRRGYRVLTRYGRGFTARDTAVIVRKRIKTGRVHVRHMGRQRWERAPRNRHKGLHPARKCVWTTLKLPGKVRLRVWTIHMPPGPYTPAYPLRHRARDKAWSRLTRIVARWNRKGRLWAALGDWNDNPRSAVARTFEAATRSTARGSRIDYPILGPCVTCSAPIRDQHGAGDHDPVRFDILIEDRR